MIRLTWMGLAVGLVAATAGCRMCASPYDYTGPVLDGRQGPPGRDARAGSILSGVPGPLVQAEAPPDDQPNNLPEGAVSVPPTDGPLLHPEFGVDPRMILSITDRKVGEEPEVAAEEPSEVAEPHPAPAAGWSKPQPVGSRTPRTAAGGR